MRLMKSGWGQEITVGKTALYFTGGAIVYALKYHYSKAGAGDLLWILSPISFFVRLLTGIVFTYEPGAGFVNFERGIVIAPACSGVNFLIICFCTVFFPLAGRLRSPWARRTWPGAVLAGSYLMTIAVNSIRIACAVFLYGSDVRYGWFTARRIHLVEGVVVYFLFLTLFYSGARTLLIRGPAGGRETHEKGGGRWRRVAGSCSVPLFWYLLVTVAVPLLNGGCHRNRAAFVEYVSAAILSCAIVFLLVCAVRLYSGRVRYNISRIFLLTGTGRAGEGGRNRT
jgi:exosortase K